MKLTEEAFEKIYDSINYDHRLPYPDSSYLSEEEQITIACTAIIMEELSDIRKQVQLIRGLQLFDRADKVNGKGELCDPGDLSEQPVFEPVSNPGFPIPF